MQKNNSISAVNDLSQQAVGQRDSLHQSFHFLLSQLESMEMEIDGSAIPTSPLFEKLLKADQSKTGRAIAVLFRVGEYDLVETMLQNAPHHTEAHIVSDIVFTDEKWYILARINCEKHHFPVADEFFLRGYQSMQDRLTICDKLEYIMEWIVLFIESKFFDYSEQLLKTLSKCISQNNHKLYARMLYLFFLHYQRVHKIKEAITYAEEAVAHQTIHGQPTEHLHGKSREVNFFDFSELYHIHLFCGEYYSSIDKNFDKSIEHFTLANIYLSKKWKEYNDLMKLMKDIVSCNEYKNIRCICEDKIRQVLLEINLHNNYYINALKNAYRDLAETHTQIQEQILIDSLTGLYNRRYLWERCGSFLSLAQRENVPIVCLMIDFNDFKIINDRFGHLIGDKVLKAACMAIKNFFRKSDVVIRFGGDEILALLYNINYKNAEKLSYKLRDLIDNLEVEISENQRIKTSISIGISVVEKVLHSNVSLLDEMIESADRMMYNDKNMKHL